jgi:cardiolipin synthase
MQPGHEVTLLHSGAEFFPALERAIDGALESISIETYIFHDDPSGRRIANALARAAQRGVRVRVVVDGFGTGTPQGTVGAVLAAAPLELRVFRPLSRWRVGRQALRRLHRKLALIDDTMLFIGGINLIDDHIDPVRGVLDSPRLDFAIAVRGPLVGDAARTMRRVWRRSQVSVVSQSRQSAQPMHRPLASQNPRGDGVPARAPSQPGMAPAETRTDVIDRAAPRVRAALVERDNWRNRRTIERVYLRAMGQARKDIIIACAYFFPGAKFRRALAEAAARGVRVRLLLQGRIEYRLPHFGTLALHEELLRAGVEVIEYQAGFLHAKLALADQWFTVGSSNIDPFSLLLAREANVIVRDPALATALRAYIERAIAEGGKPVRWSHIVTRPWWVRAAALGAAFMLRVGVALSGRGLRY